MITVKPNKQELEAMASLNHNEQFRKIVGWFERNLDAQDQLNRTIVEDYLLRQGQGKCLAFSGIIKTFVEASKTLKVKAPLEFEKGNTVY